MSSLVFSFMQIIKKQIGSKCHRFSIVEDDDSQSGYALIEYHCNDIWLELLYVNGPFRRKGYGKALMQEVLSLAEVEKKTIRLITSCDGPVDQKDLIEFYSAFGFVLTVHYGITGEMCRRISNE